MSWQMPPHVQVLPDQLRLEPLGRSGHRDGRADRRDRGDVRAAAGGGQGARCRRHAGLPRDVGPHGRQALRARGRRQVSRPAPLGRREAQSRRHLPHHSRTPAGARHAEGRHRAVPARARPLRRRRHALARELRARRNPVRRRAPRRPCMSAPSGVQGRARCWCRSTASIRPRR